MNRDKQRVGKLFEEMMMIVIVIQALLIWFSRSVFREDMKYLRGAKSME